MLKVGPILATCRAAPQVLPDSSIMDTLRAPFALPIPALDQQIRNSASL